MPNQVTKGANAQNGAKAQTKNMKKREKKKEKKEGGGNIPYEEALLRQITSPEIARGGDALLSPSLVPARAQACHFRLEHVFENITEDFTVCFKPTLHPVSATKQTSEPITALGIQGEIGLNGQLYSEVYSGDQNGPDENYDLYYLNHTADFNDRSAVVVTLPAASLVNIHTIGWSKGTYELWFYDSVLTLG